MDTLRIIEVISVFFNLLFLYLYIKEKKVSWIYGIIGSLLGAFVVYSSNLYSETILYLFYAGMGVFGFIVWSTKDPDTFIIKKQKTFHSLLIIAGGILIAFGLGYGMSKTDAAKPYMDAMSTVFGFIATFLEVYKYFIAWSFWIVLNIYTVYLYSITELYFYAGQYSIYTFMSIYGLITWQKKLALQK